MLLTNELIFVTILCLIGTQGRPSLSFSLHPFSVFSGLTPARNDRNAVKKYSGRRISNDSLRMVYFHEQTVGVIELGPEKLLLSCEFIECYQDNDAVNLLKDLQKISHPLHIEFDDMLKLMSQCAEVEHYGQEPTIPHVRNSGTGKGLLNNIPFTLFSGIIPGTKWCGTGDIAESYHDLGTEANVDRCCRNHDLCPVKIRGYMTRYNITNHSYYTKTHCQCDDLLYNCLKANKSTTARLLGQVYFNLVQVPCVEDTETGKKKIRPSKHNF